MDWLALLARPKQRLQGLWHARVQQRQRDLLMQSLDIEGQVDLRSSGGAGSGGFLEQPVALPKSSAMALLALMPRAKARPWSRYVVMA